MSFHGTSGWGADLAERNSVALDATDYDDGGHIEVVATKRHDGNNRYLEFKAPDGYNKFLLTRDGIEDLKLFMGDQ
jgi:hypothetical protein